jgi:transposase
MAQAKTWAAFDVHVGGVVAATLERDSGQLRVQRLPGSSDEVAAFAATLPGPVRATYEAGPTGFVLARKLEAAGVECLVCAPGLIPRGPSDRVKTDRRDAERLVWLLVAGELNAVAVPSVEEEALRDLVRAREDLRGDLMRARHRMAKLLLRHEVRFDGPQANWTQAHLGWLAGVELASRRRSGRWRARSSAARSRWTSCRRPAPRARRPSRSSFGMHGSRALSVRAPGFRRRGRPARLTSQVSGLDPELIEEASR